MGRIVAALRRFEPNRHEKLTPSQPSPRPGRSEPRHSGGVRRSRTDRSARHSFWQLEDEIGKGPED